MALLCVAVGVLLAAPPSADAATEQSLQQAPSDSVTFSDLRVRKLFVRGLTQTYLKDYDKAAALFEKALDRAPRSPALLSALSEAEAGRDNLTSAIFYARQARSNAPDTAYYHLDLARLLTTADQPEAAIAAYETLLERFPEHTEGRRAFAHLLREQGRTRAALRQYEALVETSKQVSPEVYHEMLTLYRKTGDQARLEQTLRTLVKLRSDRAFYRRLLGQLYTKQHRYEEAIPLFEALLHETPNNPRLLSQLKMLYLKTDQPDKVNTLGTQSSSTATSPDQLVARSRSIYENAPSPPPDSTVQRVRTQLQEALDQSPDHVGALDLLAQVYSDLGRPEKAAATLQRALDVNPRSARRWERAAAAALKADSLQAAAALAEEGTLLFPGRYTLARLEAQARLGLGEFRTARQRFSEALSRVDTNTTSDRERALLHTGRGRALFQLGRWADAEDAYKAALRLAPTHPEALAHYARGLTAQEGELPRALGLAQRAVEAAPDAPVALGSLAWVYTKQERYEEAKTTFEQALSGPPVDAWIYERASRCPGRGTGPPLARRYWTQALERAPWRDELKQKLHSVPQS